MQKKISENEQSIENEFSKHFHVYEKQADMFRDIDTDKLCKNKRPFSFETPVKILDKEIAKRKFFSVDCFKTFWEWYKRDCMNGKRHVYEMIREGLPCRLYFDIEYLKAENINIDSDEILSNFLLLVIEMLYSEYEILVDKKSFLLLDSSTEKKFSIHAICHLSKDTLFPNNIVIRGFIEKLQNQMLEKNIGIVKKNNENTWLCDGSVYTRNRNFRILYSSKCFGEEIFKLYNKCVFYDNRQVCEYQMFLDSLIVPENFVICPIISIPLEKNSVILKRMCCETVKPESVKNEKRVKPMKNVLGIGMDSKIIDFGDNNSPFKMLDDFICKCNLKYVENVEIKNWALIQIKICGSLRIQYQLRNCKYCFAIKREHKSNNVYWTFQFDKGIIYQKCFDYDCRNFVSPFISVPDVLLQNLKDILKMNYLLQSENRFEKAQISTESYMKSTEFREPPSISEFTNDSNIEEKEGIAAFSFFA